MESVFFFLLKKMIVCETLKSRSPAKELKNRMFREDCLGHANYIILEQRKLKLSITSYL